MNTSSKSIAVLGAGAWGTALALYLSRRGQPVKMWTIEADHAAEMQAEKTNRRYLSGFPFPETLQPTGDLAEAVKGVEDILITVPSVGFRNTLNLLKPFLTGKERIISATKGIDGESGQLLHEVISDTLGTQISYAVLSGPSFAAEVAKGLPTAVVIASNNEKFSQELLQRFNSPIFRVYLGHDIVGVEVGAVVKNVLAISTGISDGMGYGSNARCALITRGLAEMQRLGVALGANSKTFMGLSGLGDLVLTCSDDQSRNRRFGLALGRGEQSASAEKSISHVVEGKRNAELVVSLAKKHGVDMPISTMVLNILEGKMPPQTAMQNLLSRDTKKEYEDV